jgi:hypothetical protein
MSFRKYKSGTTKSKEKQEKDEEIKRQKGALHKFFSLSSRPSGEEAEVCASTCVTDSDSETDNSDTDIIFQTADDEISSPPEYNESLDTSDAPT